MEDMSAVFFWRSTDQIESMLCSYGYRWTIQPNTRGMNFPPAASHSSCVLIEPAKPNFGDFPNISSRLLSGGLNRFTCWCHCATLKGTRLSNSYSENRAGAVYMAPINLKLLSPVFSYSKEVGCSASKVNPASIAYFQF